MKAWKPLLEVEMEKQKEFFDKFGLWFNIINKLICMFI